MSRECCEDDDLNTLTTVQNHMKSALSVMQAAKLHHLSNSDLQPGAKKIAHNALHQKQMRFFSTKNKPGPSKSRIAKSSMNELKTTKSQMTSTEVQVCAICWGTDDTGRKRT